MTFQVRFLNIEWFDRVTFLRYWSINFLDQHVSYAYRWYRKAHHSGKPIVAFSMHSLSADSCLTHSVEMNSLFLRVTESAFADLQQNRFKLREVLNRTQGLPLLLLFRTYAMVTPTNALHITTGFMHLHITVMQRAVLYSLRRGGWRWGCAYYGYWGFQTGSWKRSLGIEFGLGNG